MGFDIMPRICSHLALVTLLACPLMAEEPMLTAQESLQLLNPIGSPTVIAAFQSNLAVGLTFDFGVETYTLPRMPLSLGNYQPLDLSDAALDGLLNELTNGDDLEFSIHVDLYNSLDQLLAFPSTTTFTEAEFLLAFGLPTPELLTRDAIGNVYVRFDQYGLASSLLNGELFGQGTLDLTLGLEVEAVPEPQTYALFALGLGGLAFYLWRRQKAA
ncbi:MAG: PEP-CTERM sorting domain-containing protein [Verrucomicrobiota bacterium JB022]|nr:PEP-CTERM sorting domain-containing protein [Verrucomicrobiota bacterium JB022]